MSAPTALAGKQSGASRVSHAEKHLAFRLEREEYALPVSKVTEIVSLPEVTFVPQAPTYVRGVINLRGRVIPLVDLRVRLGLERAETTRQTCAIVVQIPGENGIWAVGIVVDSVSEVFALSPQDVEKTPDFGGASPVSYLKGLAKMKDRVRILLDVEDLLRQRDLVLALPQVSQPANV